MTTKTASIREVQHNLKKILLWVASGERVTITKRNTNIAEIRSLEKKSPKIQRPNFKKRLKETFSHRIQGPSNADLIAQQRGDR